jgi:probable rRNA maturation factor
VKAQLATVGGQHAGPLQTMTQRRRKSERIEVQYATSRRGVPHARSLRKWARAAMPTSGNMTIRVVGAAESRKLNRTWRGKDKPTNVLSFPYSEPTAYSLQPTALLLGDLAICAAVVAREAREQGKPLHAHWAHMVVHGVLHLLGYDHLKSRDAKQMEALEVEILSEFGYQDPYVFQEGGTNQPYE